MNALHSKQYCASLIAQLHYHHVSMLIVECESDENVPGIAEGSEQSITLLRKRCCSTLLQGNGNHAHEF